MFYRVDIVEYSKHVKHKRQTERPPDDTSYIKHAPTNPKNSKFIYHDDNV